MKRLTFVGYIFVIFYSNYTNAFDSLYIKGSSGSDQQGSYTYSIPLENPPGVNGFKPQISLNYSSSAKNSILGVGWSLGGMSTITRCPAVVGQDGYNSTVNFTSTDRFCMDGQKLFAVNGSYGANGTEYRLQNENFTRVFSYITSGSSVTSFKAYTKEGKILVYGGTTDSQFKTTTSPVIFTWALNRVQDLNSNYYTISYNNDATNGSFTVAEIQYTGNVTAGTAPNNSITFSYEAKPESAPFYRGAVAINQFGRIKSISSYANSILVNTYNLTYQQSAQTGKSLLTNIVATDKTGTSSLLPTTFDWNGPSGSYSTTVGLPPSRMSSSAISIAANYSSGVTSGNSGSGIYSSTAGWLAGDFNGDGITDFIQPTYGSSSLPVCTSIPSTASFNCTNYTLPTALAASGDFIVGDFDGDGYSDVAQTIPTTGAIYLYFSNGDGTFTFVNRTTSLTVAAMASGLTPSAQYVGSPNTQYRTIAYNFDGDGASDIFMMGTNSGVSVLCPFTGGRIGVNPCYTISFPDFSPVNVVVGDFNGDGISDVAYVPANTSWTPGSGLSPIVSGKIRVCYYAGANSFSCEDKTTPSNNAKFFTGDFNMDGTSDLAQIIAGGQIVSYSNVAAGVALNVVTGSASALSNLLLAADLNGDEKIDVISRNPSTGATSLCYSRGDGNFDCTSGPTIADPQIIFGNFINGNATTSIASGSTSGTTVNLYANPTTYSDLLTTVENGIGGKTTVSYKLLTDNSVYTKLTGSLYPIQDVQSAMWVLSQVRQSDGIGGETNVLYNYLGARYYLGVPYSPVGKGFLGFQQVNQIDLTKKITTQLFYNQNFPINGQVAQVSTLTFNSQIGNYVLTADNYYSYSQRTLAKNIYGQTVRALTLLSNKQEKRYDLNSGNLISDVGTSLKHDEYGNVIVENKTTSDGYGFQTKKSITNILGTLPDDANAWYLGRVDYATQVNTTADGLKGVKTKSFSYNSRVNLTQETLSPNTPTTYLTTNYTYDSFGNVLTKSISGSNLPSRTDTMTYDVRGQALVTKANAYGQAAQLNFDLTNGNLLSIRDLNGLVTHWNYDTLGRKVKEIRPDGSTTSYLYKVCTTLICGNNRKYYVQAVVSGGNTSYAYFDALDRQVLEQVGGVGGQWIYRQTQYNTNGNIDWVARNSNGQPKYFTRYFYDEMNRVVKQVDPDESYKSFSYKDLTKVSTNNKNQNKTETVNSLGLLVSSKDDANNLLKYQYNPFGKIITVTDPNSNVTTTAYDSLDHKISSSDKDSGTWTYLYNAAGELISMTDAKSNTTSMTFDNLGRMTSRTVSEGTTTWVYDSASRGVGKVASISAPGGHTKTFAYDSLSRATSVQISMDTTYNISNTFDSYGRISQVTFPTGYAIKYKYDLNGFLAEVDNASDGSLIWKVTSANADGAPLTEKFGNNLIANKSYFPDSGRLKNTTVAPSGGGDVFNLSLEYDSLGNVTSRADLTNPSTSTSVSETFYYDNLNRLTSISGSNPKSFAYDAIGNMVNKSDVGAYTYGNGASGNPIHGVVSTSGIKNLSFTYDANGNMLTGNGRTTTWTSFNKPATIANSGNTISYSYDGNLERYKEVQTTCKDYHGTVSSSCTKYMINPAIGTGVQFEKEVVGSVVTNRHYITVGQGNVVAVYATYSDGSPSMSYLHKDHLGTVNLVTDSSGNVVERLSFDAFGKRRNLDASDDTANSLRSNTTHQGYTFHQHLDDGSMALVHMNGRVFDPLVARFMGADPVIADPSSSQAFNRYTYVNNNPLNNSDPTGYWSLADGIRDAANSISNTISSISRNYSAAALLNPALGFTGSVVFNDGKQLVDTINRNLPAVNRATGIFIGISFPFSSVVLLNTTTVFQDNFGFSQIDKNNFNAYYVALAAAGAGAVSGGSAASSLGFASGSLGAIGTGIAVGSAAGGAVGAFAFPAVGLGDSQQGFAYGAIFGGIGGGAMTSFGNYSVAKFDPGTTLQKGLDSLINSTIKGFASPGSSTPTFALPSGTEFTTLLANATPYVYGIAGGLVLNYEVYEASAGRWNIPVTSQSWSFK